MEFDSKNLRGMQNWRLSRRLALEIVSSWLGSLHFGCFLRCFSLDPAARHLRSFSGWRSCLAFKRWRLRREYLRFIQTRLYLRFIWFR